MKLKILAFCCISVLAINAQAGWLADLLLPTLTEAQKEWRMYQRGVATTDPFYPLQVLSDGYKMIDTYRVPKWKGPYGRTRTAYDAVHWGWQVTVKNLSAEKRKVIVIYKLQDGDGFELTTSYGGQWIDPGMTATVQETDTMPYDKLKRLSQSSWTIR